MTPKTRPNNTADAFAERIISHAFDLHGRLDDDGRVIELSGGLFTRTTIDPKRLEGQAFAETAFWQSSESNSKRVVEAVGKAIAGEAQKLVVEFRASSAEKIPVELVLVPAVNGEAPTIFLGARLIPAEASHETRERRWETQLLIAAENAEIGLWLWDLAKQKFRATPICAELLGVDVSDPLTYKAFVDRVHPDDRDSVVATIEEAARSGGPYEHEFRVVDQHGRTEWLAVKGRSFLRVDGSPDRMTGIFRNVTAERLAADELAAVYVREKAARDEAVLANRAKDVFLAFVSHELRAPLNAILGWSNILLSKEVDPETRRNAIATIEKSARMQTKLINDLVDSARVASGKIRLEYRPTDLYAIVRNAFELQRPAAEMRGLQFEMSDEDRKVFVRGDANRLQQVFVNLLSNAIKFTPPGGSVKIEMETGPSTAKVTIIDSGEGIRSEVLPNIFKQFAQGNEGEKRGTGLGLGLSIAKTLVERHGGRVTAESEGVGMGSRFTVELPTLRHGEVQDTKTERSSGADEQPLTGLHILVVEDENDSREVLRLHLENEGATVAEAPSAEHAVVIVNDPSFRADAMISDIGMPGEDGIALIKRIRASESPTVRQLPAIALSAFATNEVRETALAAGFDAFHTKPFDSSAITQGILDVIRKRK